MSVESSTGVPATRTRRRGLIVAGTVVLLAGIGAGLGIVGAARSTYEDAVRDLARVPVGCETDVTAEASDSFVVYVETKGTLDDVRGDCEPQDSDYERDDQPDVDVTIRADDEDVEIDEDDDGASYDAAGFEGHAIGTVELEEGTRYSVTVVSDDDGFAVALGHDPKADAERQSAIGIAIAAAGLAIGVVLIVLGMRRRRVRYATGDGFGYAPPGAAPASTLPPPPSPFAFPADRPHASDPWAPPSEQPARPSDEWAPPPPPPAPPER